ncbi:MAG: hypothetical protein JEZ06_14230 [Anaerolineaceae bacterium]|nr:hypothetical protein [Anaerolineaceae bacterium]
MVTSFLYDVGNKPDHNTHIYMETKQITSFIIRFFHDDLSKGECFHRGVISHVQNEEDLSFTRWKDAVDFIGHYVPLEPGKTNHIPNSDNP